MQVAIVDFRARKHLGIVQLATPDQDSFSYVGSGRALSEGFVEAKELGGGGSVNTIAVVNHSPHFVFLMDGDILAGAKQNRVINTSVLLAPASKTEVPVSCVEAGRWQHASSAFRGTDYTAPSAMRAQKADHVRTHLRTRNSFEADQRTIWQSVHDYQTLFRVASSTSNLSDVYDQREREFTGLLSAFTVDPQANGLAVFFGKQLAGIDIFNRKDVYAEYFPKLLRGAAMEAGTHHARPVHLGEAEARYRTLEALDMLEVLEREERPGVGTGRDRRFDGDAIAGFELMYEHHLIHAGVFAKKKG